MNIEDVITLGPTCGSSSSGASLIASDISSLSIKCCHVNLIHHSVQWSFTRTEHPSEDVMSSNSLIGTEICAMKTRSLNQLTLHEGRSLLVLGLLRKLLETRGHSVSCYTNIPQVL